MLECFMRNAVKFCYVLHFTFVECVGFSILIKALLLKDCSKIYLDLQ